MVVELVEDRARLVLEYIAMLQRQGHRPTVGEVEAYAARPHIQGPTRHSFAASIGSMMDEVLSGPIVTPGETYINYFKRLRWAKVSGGVVMLTPLALAMLRDLNSPKVDSESQSYVEVTVDPADKMSFARLLNQFNNLGQGLLVDPYLALRGWWGIEFVSLKTRGPVALLG
jgi:hypothetical protein